VLDEAAAAVEAVYPQIGVRPEVARLAEAFPEPTRTAIISRFIADMRETGEPLRLLTLITSGLISHLPEPERTLTIERSLSLARAIT
jgi:hypothetical protein